MPSEQAVHALMTAHDIDVSTRKSSLDLPPSQNIKILCPCLLPHPAIFSPTPSLSFSLLTQLPALSPASSSTTSPLYPNLLASIFSTFSEPSPTSSILSSDLSSLPPSTVSLHPPNSKDAYLCLLLASEVWPELPLDCKRR